jgi:flagellar biogenesis protein FliO
MDREMVAMWRTANGLVGVPGQMPHQVFDAMWDPGDTRTSESESAGSKVGWRHWIPSLDRMPPLVQFLVRATQWFNAKCRPTAKKTPPLRLVGQLALGGKRQLSLVEVAGLQFLIGGGAEHVTVIVPMPTSGPLPKEEPQNTGRQHQS